MALFYLQLHCFDSMSTAVSYTQMHALREVVIICTTVTNLCHLHVFISPSLHTSLTRTIAQTYQLLTPILDAGGLPKLDVCRNLQPEDYIDVMWTTSSELPGILLIAILFPFFGRRVLMAGGMTLCAIFTSLLYLCQHRYVVRCVYSEP